MYISSIHSYQTTITISDEKWYLYDKATYRSTSILKFINFAFAICVKIYMYAIFKVFNT